MKQLNNALIIIETALAVLLMAGVLIQTPKASGLGGTIGTTWVLAAAFLICSIALTWIRARNLG